MRRIVKAHPEFRIVAGYNIIGSAFSHRDCPEERKSRVSSMWQVEKMFSESLKLKA
jgi:hypothetical protein